MRLVLLSLCVFSSIANAQLEPLKAGDRVLDSRNNLAGNVVRVLDRGAVEVKLDNKANNKVYSAYYAAELGPQIQYCSENEKLCKGDTFKYTLPFIGKDRVGTVVEVFQGSDGYTKDNRFGKIVYEVQFDDEAKVRFLNSDHLKFMDLLN